MHIVRPLRELWPYDEHLSHLCVAFAPGVPWYPQDMKLYHSMIRVRDLDRSLEFYTGFLGLEEVRRHDLGDEATLVFLSDESRNYYLELTYNKDGRDYEAGNQFGHLAFLSEDLDSVIADVESKGWWFRRSKPGNQSRYIFVKDPDGYDIEILQAR